MDFFLVFLVMSDDVQRADHHFSVTRCIYVSKVCGVTLVSL